MSNTKGGWREFTLRDVLKLRRERARGSEDLLSVTQDRGIVRQTDAGRRDISSEDKSSYLHVYPGDVVYNTMRMWQGVVGRSEFDGIVSPAYTVCYPTSLADTRFLAYKLKHPAMIAEFYRLSQGLVSDTWNLKYSSFSTIKICLPDRSEQARIADILSALDMDIRAEEVALGKVRVMQSGTLRDLMTRGMRGSASEWSTVPCRVAFRLASGLPYAQAQPDSDGQIPIYGSSGRAGLGKIPLSLNPTFTIGRVGEGGVGSVYYVESPAWITDNALWATWIDPDWVPEFVARYLSWFDLRRFRGQTGQPLITQTIVGACPLVKPSLVEQREIVNVIRQWESCEQSAARVLVKLRLLRQGLMDELLTGLVRASDG